ncbi:NAD(P)-binding domain-containing protein [Variovorax saccharolyticus]|uniref:NAD(P)-binding domain-containing protein n=1 Tax=Variovorax saccharolyticus TaxID=3053516 RepID=UPI002574F436|nr:NAD(P)-binding domain-containing protein [Variovorax sp. J31P216]MDM0025418.1 NAD(P)-binding domain-containing protein [Variovorax sp. J31P216]
MKIAIIGLGEVGRCYAEPLHQMGCTLGLCEARPSAAARDLAASAGLPIHPQAGGWLHEADLVLSCVTGTTSLPVLAQALPHLSKNALLADFTTASPEVKREGASRAAAAGIRYVDTAIMGGISLHRVRTPLLAAGEGAEELKDILERAGARVQVIAGGSAGDAISLKILRSVFTKGMEALSVELLMSAEKQGVREALYQQLKDIDEAPLRSFMDMMVRTHVIHARRRAHEVHDAQNELASQGLPSTILPGVEQRFQKTAKALETHPLPVAEPSIEQTLGWLLSTAH